MVISNRINLTPDNMTIRELAHLRLLNDRLADVEGWTREQVAICENTAGGAAVRVQVSCYSRTQRLVFESGEKSVRAVLDNRNCEKVRAKVAPFADMLMCAFFVTLHSHLSYDWSALLRVDRIRAHISDERCREFHVCS